MIEERDWGHVLEGAGWSSWRFGLVVRSGREWKKLGCFNPNNDLMERITSVETVGAYVNE